ncbi:hypothetical protein [Haloprofundus marisrubri]|uniref:hypothetical protein n=1 Tax=Haloprofundus marisrubri TaxID=1514971 RepID=UPI0012BA8F0D|nr:hypothetical protein [Haloprofundus marisrubri]
MKVEDVRALLSVARFVGGARDRAEVPLNVAPLLLFGLILVVLTVIAEVSL